MTAVDPASRPGRAAQEFMLSPATRLLWRSPDVVHFEQGERAVIVEGLAKTVIRRLVSPTGRPGASGPAGAETAETAEAAEAAAARPALIALAEAGYLWQRRRPADDERLTPPVPRLAGELTALAARHGQYAADVLRGRQLARVHVVGPARVAAPLAAVLAAAGVGRVYSTTTGDAKLRHAAPGGVLPADEGRALSESIEQALRRAAPDVETRPLRPDEHPDLTILAVDEPVSEDRRNALHAAGAAHLPVTVGVDFGTVGPLVVPGITSCLQCADRHRRDRDPAWPALAVQLAVQRRYGPASDVAVGTTIAGIAAMQVLAFLDGDEPAVLESSLELHLPDWRVRRRRRPPHPDCACRLDGAGA